MKHVKSGIAGLVSILATPVWADAGYYNHMGESSGWFFGPVLMILMLAALALAVVFLVRLFGGTPSGENSAKQNAALDLLKTRFANGEIDEEEYRRRKQTLLE